MFLVNRIQVTNPDNILQNVLRSNTSEWFVHEYINTLSPGLTIQLKRQFAVLHMACSLRAGRDKATFKWANN